MSPAQSEADFMAALFEDLDSTTFDLPPSSPVKPPSQPRRSQKLALYAPRRAQNAVASTSTEPAAPRSPVVSPRKKRPLFTPFLDDKPTKTSVHKLVHAAKSAVKLEAKPNVAPLKRPLPISTGKPKIAVKLEEKENAGRTPTRVKVDLKGKRRVIEDVVPVPQKKVKLEDVDVAALCDGMDWEADFALSQELPEYVPRSKQYTRCSIISITDGINPLTKRTIKTLEVTVKNRPAPLQVVLTDDWLYVPLETGDAINLIGAFDHDATPSMTLSSQKGLLILHPDILASSTKVADSSHCARKAILQEIIRTSPSTSSISPSLVYGNMLHELMQHCLLAENFSEEERRRKGREIVQSQMGQLWIIEIEAETALEALMTRSEKFEEIQTTFIGKVPKPTAALADPRPKEAAAVRLAINDTLDIEEDIWSPRYGLKGKVDVSVAVRLANGPFVDKERKTMPFEIKTGRSVAGLEHRAQTMLYALLMSERYGAHDIDYRYGLLSGIADETIDSGLLFYSQSNDIFRVQAAHNEIRALIMARNEFATYLHRRMTLSKSWSDVKEDEDAPAPSLNDVEEVRSLLPRSLDDERSCKRCYVKEACMLYRKAVDGDKSICDDDADALQMIFDDSVGHLTSTHAEFFKKWERLVSLEEQELVRFRREIWTMTAEERAKSGRCLPSMSIDESFDLSTFGPASAHRYTYRLQHSTPLATQATRSQRCARSLLGGVIAVNDAVVVSLEHPSVLGIAHGFVLALTSHDIVLGLDHSLTDNTQAKRTLPLAAPSELLFRIDKDELSTGLGRLRDNLVQLFAPSGDEKRRKLVVDLQAPDLVQVASLKKLIPPGVNSDQAKAVEKVLSARDYALVLGMPGTGKTTTIAHLLRSLAAAGKSILLTSYTHSAVDNILLKIADDDLSILRLGKRDKIMPSLHRFTLDPENPAQSLAQQDRQLMEPQIVATTCLGINEPLFARRRFDVCIVDEASQVTLPACLGPLRYADTFILVGDHNQLPPLVRNRDARLGGLDVSLFKRLSDAHPSAVVHLTQQYRMNEDIMLLSNELVYERRLCVGSEEVADRTLALPRFATVITDATPAWIKEVLQAKQAIPHYQEIFASDQSSCRRKVVFVDTDLASAIERKLGSLVENECEARLVRLICNSLVSCGAPQMDIGVIAPYRQQIKLLLRKLGHLPDIEVLTADRSQGRDKECIVMSMTRSNPDKRVGDLLSDWRRMNVCFTRAKSKLIIFGSRSTLVKAEVLAKFFDILESRGWIYALPADTFTSETLTLSSSPPRR